MFHVLGQFPIVGRHRACVVQFGKKLLVVAETSAGVEKLTEISDPEEIDRIVALCGSSSSPDLAAEMEPHLVASAVR